ncbi:MULTISPECIES: ATP-binding cassette domain-containing protein [unclassified Limnohabitans]|jgi:peptide/nickel transport system ATP-binding protein|uniref:ATP-binding cassette domain-containing protein n=1 Tax=unclassified Limnohabitans TaxID=2626134 RepID=UPI0006DC1E9E|nr:MULTISPECIES: ATP-binding cassette domain-containing protein [unclassified Limnohabitans]ALK91075.1 Oligopeptide transport ATP-binding protein OppF [Limnohabitans sp. 103DPR2]PUE35358.1 ABC transporter ATP-binding protein [Limnohabitans sp. Hippo4]
MSQQALLQVKDLRVNFPQGRGKVFQALKGISLDIQPGETVGLVGESGSGKTTVGRVILGLTEATSGDVWFEGENITHASRERRRALGRDIQVVFQDPYGSLNPARTIGDTLAEPLMNDKSLTGKDISERVAEVLQQVGMPTDTASRYPGMFSGGQRQRIAIARAVIAKPRLIVCDEPVSALDLSVQAQVLNLLKSLQQSMGLAMLFISHDLTVVRHVSHRTVVLYRGDIVEQGDAGQVHDHPEHPYTRALLAAAPVPDPLIQRERRAQFDLARQALSGLI